MDAQCLAGINYVCWSDMAGVGLWHHNQPLYDSCFISGDGRDGDSVTGFI